MIGRRISHYKISEKLGQGGMGEIFLAEDTKLERKVALKFLPGDMTCDREACIRFEREAKAAAALNHPNIVTVYEINEFDNRIYLAMEYIDGVTLKDWPRPAGQGLRENGPAAARQINEILHIAIQVCEGLKEAHHAGIVHRDIKPENIILDKKNRVKILDFGLAKLRGVSKITEAICRIGTVNYMSPEQARGEELDLRTDIWSFGVLLYELATGVLPFTGSTEAAVIKSIMTAPFRPPAEMSSHIPPELEKIISRCLLKDRAERCPAVEPLLRDLYKLAEDLGRKLKKQHEPSLPEEQPAAGRETERRQASVIFTEICGYDDMLQELGNEETAAIMNQCFRLFTDGVVKHGGRIEKIIERSLIALFGVPMVIEGTPKEAVNAAIAMRSGLYRFSREKNLKIALDIRIGINSGTVISSPAGKDEADGTGGNVMGDTITQAAQLKDLTPKGKIYVGPLTFKYTKEDFDYREVKSIILRSKARPAAVFELLSEKEKMFRPVSGIKNMIPSKMAGRDKEIDKIRLHVVKAVNGEGSILSITGQAGIGKSRLITELKKSEDLTKVTLLEGRAPAAGKNLSYHAAGDIIKKRAAITEEDSEAAAFAKLKTIIADLEPEKSREILPVIASMMKLELPDKDAEGIKGIKAEVMEKLIVKNLRLLLKKIAERKPAVIIIDDLHWADASTLECLEAILQLAGTEQILFILIARPTTAGKNFLKSVKERYDSLYEEIYLEPLKKTECRELIRGMIEVSGLPPQTEAAITGRAEGNPFFIEEVVRSFLDAGLVKPGKKKLETTDRIDAVMVPETIQDVIMVRIDRLDEKSRTLLKEAAVIGRNFLYKILCAVTEIDHAVDERLENLRKADIIDKRTRSGELEYFFKHALTRQVVYDSILLKKREELHIKIAHAVESVFAAELPGFYSMLALHYGKGGDLPKTGEYLKKAAEEALKTAASGEALHYYGEALRIYRKKHGKKGDPETTAGLEWNIGKAYFDRGHMREAVKHFDRVLELWGESKSTPRGLKHRSRPGRPPGRIPTKRENDIFAVKYRRCTALAAIDTHRMVKETDRFLETVQKYDLAKVRDGVNYYASLSALIFFSGTSFAVTEEMLDYARGYITSSDPGTRFAFDFWELLFDTLSGNWRRELIYDETVINDNLKRGELYTVPGYLFLGGMIKTEQGSFEAVKPHIDKLDEISDTFANDQALLFKYTLNSRYLLKRRQLFKALEEVEAGIALADSAARKPDLMNFNGLKANIQILLGETDRAEKTVNLAAGLADRYKLAAPLHTGSFQLSRFLLHLCKLEKSTGENNKTAAKKLRREARRSGKELLKTVAKNAAYRTEALRLTGTFHWLAGEQKKALSYWGQSISSGEQLGDRPELGRTYVEVGQRLQEKKSKFKELSGISAKEYRQRAWYFFKEMNLEWDLDRWETHANR